MGRKALMAAAAAALTLAGVLAAPVMVGVRTEEKIRQDIDQLERDKTSTVSARLEQYDRGWFASSARVLYSVPLGDQLARLAVDYRVNQLPIPFQRWTRTDYTVTPVDAAGKPLGDPLPLTAYSIKNFLGGLDTFVDSAELNWREVDGSALTLNGLNAEFHSEDGKPMQYRASVGGLTLRAPLPEGRQLAMLAGKLTAEGRSSPAFAASDVWQMEASQRLDSLEIQINGQSMARFGKLSMDAALQDKGALMDALYHSRIGEGQLGAAGQAVSISDLRLDFSLINLDKQGYADWQTRTRQLYSVYGQDQQALAQGQLDGLMQSAPRLLAASPAFRLDQLSFTTANGALHASMELRFDGSGLQAASVVSAGLPALMRDRLAGRAALQLDKRLLTQAAAMAGEGASAAAMTQAVESGMQQAVRQGWVNDGGDKISTDASFSRDGASINGHPMPDMARLLRGTASTVAAEPALPAASNN
ncbi:DUF945 family protein [uncultured Aquitalea sp.]|uniref:DUF945 family protein n=1 Tax=uncultured Aquitalea sp. TaxID=540272 RepID=UPI0025E9EE78|nr:DUF945 family protein [uncultured Aquitalea sp.]